MGPRPHVRQRLLRRQQHLRHAGRARRPDQRADAGAPRGAGVARHVLPPAAHRWSTTAGPGRLEARLRREGRARPAGGGARLRAGGRTGPGGPTPRSGPRCSTRSSPVATCSPTTRGCRATSRAAPNIVINEIQHSPTAGTRRRVRGALQPVGHRGHRPVRLDDLRTGSTCTIQPGTVILPRGTMTFVANDPAFRAATAPPSSSAAVYTGDLASGETLTLNRGRRLDRRHRHLRRRRLAGPDSGQSLELANPASDNNRRQLGAVRGIRGDTWGAEPDRWDIHDRARHDCDRTGRECDARLVVRDHGGHGFRQRRRGSRQYHAPEHDHWCLAPAERHVRDNFRHRRRVTRQRHGRDDRLAVVRHASERRLYVDGSCRRTSTNADLSPATRTFSVSAGGGPDTVAPNGTLSVPTNNQVFTGGVVTMSGGATDNIDVGRVGVAIRNTATGQWLRSNGTFGADHPCHRDGGQRHVGDVELHNADACPPGATA